MISVGGHDSHSLPCQAVNVHGSGGFQPDAAACHAGTAVSWKNQEKLPLKKDMNVFNFIATLLSAGNSFPAGPCA